MEETKTIALSDGRSIMLDDDDDILLSLVSDQKTENVFQIPAPSGGYGGGSLLLSPSGQYLLFSYFSGQSEEGFMLFRIGERHPDMLYDSKYLYGEDAHYCFIKEEKIIVQTFRTDYWYEENAQSDENGDRYYEFGEMNFFHIDTLKQDRHIIHVYPSDDWEEEETDVGAFRFLECTEDNKIHAIMPWGEETFAYPPQAQIIKVYNDKTETDGENQNAAHSDL